MNLIDKYIPTSQKSLFHKDICAHIRKWTTYLIESESNDKKKILFIYGPVGCGKSASLNILLKPFEVINIDSNELRQEKTCDIINCIVGFNDITLSNIEKWNHANKKQKPNIILIDNIELCDKTIVNFVENIHNKNKINVPIVLICNNIKYKNLFINSKNSTYIEFNKPSLLELTKLISNINTNEHLNLTKQNISTIITKSEFDIRQIFYLLDQWKIHPFHFDNFMETISEKHADIDLTDKLLYLTDITKPFDLSYTFTLSTSEPISLSNGIFQNYINIIDYYDTLEPDTKDDKKDIIINILESISDSNVYYSKIIEEQMWDLYDSFSMKSCVLPSYYIKNYKKLDTKHSNTLHEKELYYKMNAFKDISYNYLNSFNDLKTIASENIFCKKLNINTNYDSYNIIKQDPTHYFDFIQLCITQIKIINEHFETNKKGKNTTKSEKIELCKSITGHAEKALDFIVNNIYSYKFFEIPIDDILLNKHKYLNIEITTDTETTKNTNQKTKSKKRKIKEENSNISTEIDTSNLNDKQIINDIEKIDIRIFKRLLNIFSFTDSSKVLKSHVEMGIKYKIFKLLLEEIKLKPNTIKETRIESLVQDINEIWNI